MSKVWIIFDKVVEGLSFLVNIFRFIRSNHPKKDSNNK